MTHSKAHVSWPYPVSAEGLLSGLPDPAVLPRRQTLRDQITIVVDDDPTGPQCVRDVPVITRWTEQDFVWGLAQNSNCLFVLTNSRSMDAVKARDVVNQVVQTALRTPNVDPRGLRFLSRSDSTLRGHFPLETDTIHAALNEVMEPRRALTVLAPAFPSAGRITLDGVHWVVEGGVATPVGMTGYARDETFGFGSSDLCSWVSEKTGRPRVEVRSIRLAQVRRGFEAVAEAMRQTPADGVVVVDAVEESDLDVLAAAVADVEAAGWRVVTRGAPGLARAMIGQRLPGPLSDSEVRAAVMPGHGLVVVGSHVSLSSRQLERVDGLLHVVLDVDRVLSGALNPDECAGLVYEHLLAGDTMLSTSRTLRHGRTAAESLSIARQVADTLVAVTRGVLRRVEPAWLLGKGGITSSDLLSKSAGFARATVLGQLLPGMVPVLRGDVPCLGDDRRCPCVIFPGNVGSDDTLAEAIARLQRATLFV